MNQKTPACYKTPLKSRADIAAFLFTQRSYSNYPHEYCRFVWDVKLYGLNLDYDYLLDLHKKSGYNELGKQIDHPEVQEIYMQRYQQLMNNYELEDEAKRDSQRDLNDTDSWRYLWDGTKLGAGFRMYGRSEGYIGLESFLDWYDFTQKDDAYWNLVFRGNPFTKGSLAHSEWSAEYPEMDYNTLRLLYQAIVMYNYDFTRKNACIEVEHAAGYHLFALYEDEIEEEWENIMRRDINRAGYAVMEELLHAT